ncbi:ParB/RepB/Spo0J family partition protein [Caldithrix abyssi]|uniref:Chromosome segregation DNA-binding protein n=1 Tax=Caldithrix abyssi DSM 13497 TaxID=880073 RepID=H1XNV1_CALAY|nr:ParB/RepB/Spo0J family partition protein [Caldithrix abyssi]APF19786.1 chromosome segregation DNA-binding protein [Caldithrix abyssi DSM 13497]EHO39891.1 parB-like partition protein [Caldithrix abyssi DSM 13497]
MKKTNRLGRGLSALIPEKEQVASAVKGAGSLTEVEVALVRPNPFQPRQDFDPRKLEELKASIEENGIIQPITVRRKDNYYELIAGERRLRAVSELGYEKIPAYIIEVETKEEMLELALIENVQRDHLNPIEQAQAYQRLIEECNLTQDEVAKKIGKDRSTITNFIRLLKLPPKIRESVQKEEISMGHARALLSVEDKDAQFKIWQKVVKNKLSVRKVEQMVKDFQQKKEVEEQARRPKRSVYIQRMEAELREIFGTKVNIRSRKEGGTIEVEFYSPEDLNRLYEIFERLKE